MRTVFTCYLLSLMGSLWAQCPATFEFTTQQSLDDFAVNYPNCTSASGNVTVSGTSVTSLSPLSNLVEISGVLQVSNTSLTSMAGLEGLSHVVGGVKIFKNDQLTGLGGLEGLQTVDGFVHVGSNYELLNLDGLSGLTSIGGYLRLFNNIQMTDVSGLDALQHVGSFISIKYNDALLDIPTFNNLTSTPNRIRIEENLQLKEISGFNGLDSVQHNLAVVQQVWLDSVTGFSALTHVGENLCLARNFRVDNLSGFDALTEVNGAMYLGRLGRTNEPLNMNGFNSLERINGILRFWGGNMSSIGGFNNLQDVSELIVENVGVNDISGFNALVNGNLTISSNSSLDSITGFQNLQYINGDLTIFNNYSLDSITGFQNLDYIGGNFSMSGYSPSFKSIVGLSSLDTIQGNFTLKNTGFVQILGLQSLQYIGGNFQVSSNSSLQSLDSLTSLNHIGGGVTITYNSTLGDCSIFSICNFIADDGSMTVSNNNPGCENAAQIINNCVEVVSSATGMVYADFDCDHVFNNADVPLPNRLIKKSSNNGPIAMSNTTGAYVALLEGVATTSFYADTLVGYQVTPPLYTITTNYQPIAYNQLNFAFCPNNDVYDLGVSVATPNPVRPGFTTTYQVCYTNQGTQPADALLTFYTSGTAQPYSDISAATGGTISGDTATFLLADVAPFQTLCKSVTVQMATNTPLGTLLTANAFIETTDDIDENDYYDNYATLTKTVVGSYDPNDKTSDPPNINIDDLTDSTRLKYLIRFQNTGTYMATFIEVIDTLEEDFDISTFEMLGASHDYTLTFSEDRILKWRFDNINLPDSTSDEPGSHGYILYRISPVAGLQLGDILSNGASIYFDYNPPIHTNVSEAILFTNVPISANNTINIPEDEAVYFDETDFPTVGQLFPFESIKVMELPDKGILQYNSVAVVPGQVIEIANLSGFSYTPLPNEFGPTYTSFKFKVANEFEWSTEMYTMYINVSSVNDPPTSLESTLSTNSNMTYFFTGNEFGWTDIDDTQAKSVRIVSIPEVGSLKKGSQFVVQNSVHNWGTISNMYYIPPTDEAGLPLTSFKFQVIDPQDAPSDTQTMYINVIGPDGTTKPATWTLQLMPNPMQDVLVVQGELPANHYQWALIDILGRTVKQSEGDFSGYVRVAIPVDNLPAGQYYLRVISSDGYQAYPVIKR